MTLEASLAELESLASQRAPADSEQLHEIATARAIKNEQALLELAALAADLSVDDITNLGLEPDTNLINVPNLLATYDSKDEQLRLIELLRNMDDDVVAASQLEMDPLLLAAIVRSYDEPLALLEKLQAKDLDPGALSFSGDLGNIKGKYFEELVVDRLNKGYVLGEAYLVDGQRAVFGPEGQKGWDIRIDNADGPFGERISAKTTDMDHIRRALEEYPDYRIVTTSDIDGTAEEILSTNIPNSALRESIGDWVGVLNDTPAETLQVDVSDTGVGERVRNQVAELTEDSLENFVDNALEIALDAVPIASGVIVLVTEGRAVIMGTAQLDDALKRGAKRLGKALPFTTAGAIMAAASLPGVAITPALLAGRLWASRLGNRAAMGDIAKEHADRLAALNPPPAP